MIRCRFYVPADDPRPVIWPINHPYWITGMDLNGRSVLVAYADDEDEILRNWPDAQELDSKAVEHYAFTDRFQKPDWFPAAPGPR